MKKLAAVLGVLSVLAACGGGADEPGEAAFNDANAKLTVNNKKYAFGNGPVAEQLAEKFNQRMKLIMKIGFKNRATDKAVDDEIVTYVHLTADTAIFLVHIPALRNYKEDAQGTLLEIAWPMATGRLQTLEPATERRVAVALRGVLMYGASAFGSSTSEKPDKTTHTGVIPREEFYPFFTGNYPDGVTFKNESAAVAPADESFRAAGAQ